MTLSLVRGGRAERRIGGATVHVVADDEPLPHTPQAWVIEDDRFLVLSAPTDVLIEDANPLRTMTKAHEVEAHELGTIFVRADRPHVWRAVVVDVDADVACEPSSVERAVRACMELCAQRGVGALRMDLLGSAHGRLPARESALAIARGLMMIGGEGATVELMLIVPRDRVADVVDALAAI